MKIIKSYSEIIPTMEYNDMLKLVSTAGRTCYKSERTGKIKDDEQFIRSIIKRGHESVVEHSIITVKLVTSRSSCYDNQTKVLTDKGWKFFKDVSYNDNIYTLDDNNNLTTLKPKNIIIEDYNGLLDYYRTTQLDLAVTPNHNMWVYDYHKRSKDTKVWKFLKSEELTNKRYKFKKTGNATLQEGFDTITVEPTYLKSDKRKQKYETQVFRSDYFLELLGWWITDGCVSLKNNSGHKLEITQTKTKGRDRIKFLLDSLNLNYTEIENGFYINNPSLLRWIVNKFLKEDDMRKTYYIRIPRDFLNELSTENLKSFLNGIIGGNGSQHCAKGKKVGGYNIYTASKGFAEDLVELGIKIGYTANIRTVNERTRVFPSGHTSHCQKQYVVSIFEQQEHLFNNSSKTKYQEEYNGKVYCVELPQYHRLFVMRNGKAVCCGNSHQLVRHRIGFSYSQESQRYCNYSKDKFENEITFINPFTDKSEPERFQKRYDTWLETCQKAEDTYFELLEDGLKPEVARSVLPNSTKTELIMTGNIRAWRHLLKLRTDKSAQRETRELMCEVLEKFKEQYPVFFEDL